jgi:Autographiviridae endonuclease VII
LRQTKKRRVYAISESLAKTCSRCREEKVGSLAHFRRARENKDGLTGACRECLSAHARRWRRQNLEKSKAHQKAYDERHPGRRLESVRKHHLQKTYGLTLEAYEGLLETQGGGCAVCGATSSGKRSLSVDHCHETGAVRGILCGNCNAGLGKFKDSIEMLETAIGYLRRFEENRDRGQGAS